LFTVDDWETAFGKLGPMAASTRNKYRQTVLSMQEWATDKGYLARAWLAGKVLKKGGALARRKGGRRDRRLVPDVLDDKGKVKQPGEERRLLGKAGEWLQRLIIAALETGLRRGELLSLRWADVSLTREQLTVRAETSKTRTMRQLPLSPRLLGVLKMIDKDPAGQDRKPTDYVFGDAVGRKVSDPKKAWLKACDAAGISDLHFHDLRHEAGSRMVEAGWALHHVQKMLGHEDAKTTSIYLNATVTELTDSMRRFGSGHALHDVAQTETPEPPPSVQHDDAPVAKSLVN
jgi:integrase